MRRSTDSLLVLEHQRQPGFNLGIVASLNVNPFLSLRFLPTLSFQERITAIPIPGTGWQVRLLPEAGGKHLFGVPAPD